MSIDCINATNSSAADVVVCSAVQDIPCRLSTTSLQVFDNETSGNNGVLDLNSSNSRASSRKILSNKQKPESNHEVLKRYQSLHLQSEETSLEDPTHFIGNRDDATLESGDPANPPSAAGTRKVRQNDSQAKCRFYQRDNFCKFGQNCRYLHEGGELASKSYLTFVPSTFDESYSDAFDNRRRFQNVEGNDYFCFNRRSYNARPVCRYFQYYGYCDYGDRCRFEHAYMLQTDGPKQRRQTPLKNSKKNLKEKETQRTCSVNNAAAGCTVNSDLQNVIESPVSDGDLPSPLGDMKLGTEKPQRNKTTGRKSEAGKPHPMKTAEKSQIDEPKPKLQKTTGRKTEKQPKNTAKESETEKLQLQKTTGRKSEKPKAKRATCRFFEQYGSCKYKDRCTYSHILHSFTVNSDPQSDDLAVQGDIDGDDSASPLDDINSEIKKVQSKKADRPKLETRKRADCRVFKQYGNCKYGDRCRYVHEMNTSISPKIDTPTEETAIESAPDADCTVPSNGQNNSHETINIQSRACQQSPKVEAEILEVPSKPSLPKPLTAIQIHLLDQLSEEDLKALRKTEITQLKKRFPKCEVLQEDDSGSEYVVEFIPSDPDWPFEVKVLHLKVLFPSEYPLKPCFIEVVDVEDFFPETLVRYLDRNMQSWIKKRHDETFDANKVEIVFKPFLRWLDRNLENLFINGLRMVKKERDAEAAGIEFVPYEKLQSVANQDCFEVVHEPEMDMFDNQINVAEDSAPANATTPSNEAKVTSDGISSFSLKRGTEVVLRNLALGEHAATLVCRRIALTLQCGRCKTRNEIESPANRGNKIFCTKCHHVQTLTYRPQLLHQFGCVLGYLDLVGCQVVDMPIANCHFDVTCLQCSTSMPLNGLHFGQRNDNWCHNCNSKMTILIESVKFHQLQASINQVGKGHLLKLEPKEKRVKDPAIQEGKPLPSDGTCKHFKKSYRWLRFPCCGKAYPCDVCHNEKETDHDMKYATRMICGFCAKEQIYSSEKPCVLCKSSLTKKVTTHWEGGKGCRDKTKMSREDQHKYTGTSKTISRKTQEKTKPATKK